MGFINLFKGLSRGPSYLRYTSLSQHPFHLAPHIIRPDPSIPIHFIGYPGHTDEGVAGIIFMTGRRLRDWPHGPEVKLITAIRIIHAQLQAGVSTSYDVFCEIHTGAEILMSEGGNTEGGAGRAGKATLGDVISFLSLTFQVPIETYVIEAHLAELCKKRLCKIIDKDGCIFDKGTEDYITI